MDTQLVNPRQPGDMTGPQQLQHLLEVDCFQELHCSTGDLQSPRKGPSKLQESHGTAIKALIVQVATSGRGRLLPSHCLRAQVPRQGPTTGATVAPMLKRCSIPILIS